MNIQPVILSGGAGTRLWPLSREYYPKQLLALTGDKSLLQETLARLTGFSSETKVNIDAPLVICNEEHRFLVAEQARQAGIDLRGIILEPFGRNTAPALTLAALAVIKQQDAVMMVMPADHVIKNLPAFYQAVATAYQLAREDRLVTFGIVPAHPETGYGYIRKGPVLKVKIPHPSPLAPHSIDSFTEKPDQQTAQQYIDTGDYLWNSGMFMMKASVWLKAIEQMQPDIYTCTREAYQAGRQDMEFLRIDRALFEKCPSDSIDYAVMEKVSGHSGDRFSAAVIPLDAGWSDIGSWSSLWENSAADQAGNVVSGDVFLHNTCNSLLLSENRLLACVGIEDMVVIETADAVLVASRNATQDVKKIVDMIKQQNRQEHLMHRRVHRPWGCYEGVDTGQRFQVKRITVKPGAALSLQMHHHRAEHWVVVRGTAEVTKGEEVFLISENESTYIPIGVKHRLANPGTVPLEIIEVQSGSYLGEDDIVRFDDIYGRSNQ